MTPSSPPLLPLLLPPSLTCDIFCRVVDNYGDIGVAWRLARQLAGEHGVTVRLVVDDLSSFYKLVPPVLADFPAQSVDGVTVIAWRDLLAVSNAADLVIEAFACELPAAYLGQMTQCTFPPAWINLEYLSAEAWVAEHHLLPSPHPSLPLTKFFFFPGFTADTGGLIRERDLIARRDSIARANAGAALRVLVFGYDNAPVEALFAAMAQAKKPIVCHVPESGLSTKLQQWRGTQAENTPGAAPLLEFQVLPFVPQAEFDTLLWRHDVLFVRGEDSFVRAQWAARPFVWHVYPQSDGVHLVKLNAFLDIYCAALSAAAATALRGLWQAWNVPCTEAVGPAWAAFVAELPALKVHAERWSQRLSEMPDLAANLLSFYRKNAKI